MKSALTVIGLAITLSLGASNVAAEAATSAWVPTQTKAFLHGSVSSSSAPIMALAAVQTDEQQSITVGLKLRNESQLDDFLTALQTPGNPVYHRFLTPEQFAAQYSPTKEQVAEVVNYLRSQGMTNITVSQNRTLISADGTTKSIERAFNTSLKKFTHNGHTVFANDKPAMVPAALGDTVTAVLGLQNAVQYKTLNSGLRNNVHALAKTAGAIEQTHHIPTEYPVIYRANTTPAATSATVAIITAGDMTNTLSDFESFLAHNKNLPKITPTVVHVGDPNPEDIGEVEWALDSQTIYGAAGGVKELIFYSANSLNVAKIATAYEAVVTANVANVVNVSLGICETFANRLGSQAVDSMIFRQAVAQGITFVTSSGDAGPYNCAADIGMPKEDQRNIYDVSEPASSPYVVAVGGTALYTSSIGFYSGQTVWNDGTASGHLWATGGGFSKYETVPSWQIATTRNIYRGVPDLAFNAASNSGTLIYVNEKANGMSAGTIGGTSMSSAIFAGLWARVSSANRNQLGLPTPTFYRAIPSNSYLAMPVSHTPFNGNAINYNGWDLANPGMTTTATGWNAAAGFGSLNVDMFSMYIKLNPGLFPIR